MCNNKNASLCLNTGCQLYLDQVQTSKCIVVKAYVYCSTSSCVVFAILWAITLGIKCSSSGSSMFHVAYSKIADNKNVHDYKGQLLKGYAICPLLEEVC